MRIVVTVDRASLKRIDRIARDLIQAGMTVDQILSATGIITGSADPRSLAALAALAGVSNVEPDSHFEVLADDPQ